MASWEYTTHAVVNDIRSVVNTYLAQNERPEGLTDEEYALHVLAQLFAVPVIEWRNELAARAESTRHAAELLKEEAIGKD